MEKLALENRVHAALARIEAASGRIEAAARVSAPPAGQQPDQELQARYEALQREAGEALRQIDRLIGVVER